MRQLLAASVLAMAALGLAGSDARAASYGAFTSFWAFGDSLTDDGNLYAATGGAAPPPPYFEGRFSNGPVWAEHVEADFTAAGLAAENFAFGGAAVGALANGPLPSPPVANLDGQIARFAEASRGRLGERPVASLWFGANNLLFDGIPNGDARAVGRAAARGVAAGARELQRLGVGHVVLFNLPALDKTPRFALSGDPVATEQARIGSLAFNRALERGAARLEKRGMKVIRVDMYGLFNELLADPQKFGVVDATAPCLLPTDPPRYCGSTVAQLLAFFDPVHPNATVHAAIADEVRGEVAPVPLPAPALMLLAALGALGLAARRRPETAAS